MAYGTQVLYNGQNMVTIVQPVYYMGFTTSNSGTQNFFVPAGKTLKYMTQATFADGRGYTPTVTINGSTATWSNSTFRTPILFYAE